MKYQRGGSHLDIPYTQTTFRPEPGVAPSRTHNMAYSHLAVIFFATAGQNQENLGSDEEQIVLCVYLLYDVTNNKVSYLA